MDFGTAVISLLFMVLGIVIGNKVGETLATRLGSNRQFWAYNIAAIAVGIVVSAFVSALGLLWVAGLVIGLIGGSIFGLKMGYGKSVGVWAKHDRHFRVNADQVKAGEAVKRGEDPDEIAKRDLISVAPDGEEKHPTTKSGRRGR
ncbi:MAG: hypothetical protein KHY83_09580 [Coriobacteriia bacterium]|nr:hypothetical protein [Coriobacteriia bacterium]MBS5478898.1 hypothetical protein [Coriobacteriia bacterium]